MSEAHCMQVAWRIAVFQTGHIFTVKSNYSTWQCYYIFLLNKLLIILIDSWGYFPIVWYDCLYFSGMAEHSCADSGLVLLFRFNSIIITVHTALLETSNDECLKFEIILYRLQKTSYTISVTSYFYTDLYTILWIYFR